MRDTELSGDFVDVTHAVRHQMENFLLPAGELIDKTSVTGIGVLILFKGDRYCPHFLINEGNNDQFSRAPDKRGGDRFDARNATIVLAGKFMLQPAFNGIGKTSSILVEREIEL